MTPEAKLDKILKALRWVGVFVALNIFLLSVVFGWALARTRVSSEERALLAKFVAEQLIEHQCDAHEDFTALLRAHGLGPLPVPPICLERSRVPD